MSRHVLKQQIEQLRAKLVHVAAEKGSLIDPIVVQLSQELDMLVFHYQTLRYKKFKMMTCCSVRS